ncbi:MAG: hypothetical protein OXH56_14935 [Gemmatimonadetes bacterium]|nr:hypothetical protein [Gemmatimonadota bacterium]MXY48378.1 hypothetical protein [Gemmatimonadota bacterium]MYG85576.1 hypothetical protein [Gemmatimonadota bacterium]MYJ89865.1 hypothetical protein [Gemmatimonadota bacterium]
MTDHPGVKPADSVVSETDRLNLLFSEVYTKDHSIRDRLKSIEVKLNLLIGAIPIITIILLKIVEHLFPGLK